ncbi:MAG TPA: hypothetical protein ENK80_06075 [Rhodobacterales bacterium]|nr:hypothetical protein [Rhodobacterales bacterium]
MLSNRALARNLNALAHPRRVMLFRLLIDDPSAGDSLKSLIGASGVRPSSAIHRLREMERCGLLMRRRKRLNMRYRLATGEVAAALATALRLSEANDAPRPARAA